MFQAVIRFFIHAANPPTLARVGRRRIISRKGNLFPPALGGIFCKKKGKKKNVIEKLKKGIYKC